MTVKAALLNAQGHFIRMDELEDPAELTVLHLPQITECDLPPGQYKWIADQANQMGGAFWPVKWLDQREQDIRDVEAAAKAAERIAERRLQRKRARGEA